MTVDTSKMSEGKRNAMELTESARDAYREDSSFAAGLFMGRCLWPWLYPFPEQSAADHAAGLPFLANLDRVLKEKIDPDEIDRSGEIPDDAIQALAEIGAFGIKIPEDYGGLGLSQTNYCRAAVMLGSYCGSTTALISAHQSIGVPQPLLMFGTDEQKRKYLPRVAKGEISAFALTEQGVGSDPGRMETRADPDADGRHFVINGEKLWCTNGTRAGVIVVMARTPPKVVDGKERNQITAFIVEMNTPGIRIENRCHFMGLHALYNTRVTFTDVKVPRENIIEAEGKGLKVALSTLNMGRLTLPAACVGLTRRCLVITRKWAAEREQWGSPIGHHAMIADKITRMSANLFAMEAMTFLTAAHADKPGADIRLEAAMCKMWCTEAAWRTADDTLQIRGGRGYETAASLKERGEEPVPVERLLRDSRINLIFEGSSEIMRLFIAREALDPHLRRAMPAMSGTLGARAKAGGQAAWFYAGWYARQWNPLRGEIPDVADPLLRAHLIYVSRASRKLARSMFHAMARHGPKLEREQLTLARFVEIGTELFAMSAVCSRAQWMSNYGANGEQAIALADHFCWGARDRIAATHTAQRGNRDRASYRLARSVLEGKYTWLTTDIVT